MISITLEIEDEAGLADIVQAGGLMQETAHLELAGTGWPVRITEARIVPEPAGGRVGYKQSRDKMCGKIETWMRDERPLRGGPLDRMAIALGTRMSASSAGAHLRHLIADGKVTAHEARAPGKPKLYGLIAVPQAPPEWHALTAEEVLGFPAQLPGMLEARIADRVRALLKYWMTGAPARGLGEEYLHPASSVLGLIRQVRDATDEILGEMTVADGSTRLPGIIADAVAEKLREPDPEMVRQLDEQRGWTNFWHAVVACMLRNPATRVFITSAELEAARSAQPLGVGILSTPEGFELRLDRPAPKVTV